VKGERRKAKGSGDADAGRSSCGCVRQQAGAARAIGRERVECGLKDALPCVGARMGVRCVDCGGRRRTGGRMRACAIKCIERGRRTGARRMRSLVRARGGPRRIVCVQPAVLSAVRGLRWTAPDRRTNARVRYKVH
jgi:hypothetical protein